MSRKERVRWAVAGIGAVTGTTGVNWGVICFGASDGVGVCSLGPDTPAIIGVGVIRGLTAAGFGVLSVTTSLTGVAVGSGRTCPKTDAAPAKSEIKQKTTLVIIRKLGEL